MSTMQITREDLNPCTIKLSITCDPQQVQEGFSKAYKAYSERIRVPGFRPGKAPKAVLEPLINKNDLYNVAAEEIIKAAIVEAYKTENIRPHEAPSVEVQKIDEEAKELEFTAKVPLEPIVELGDYKGIEVSIPTVDVSDAEVMEQVDELRKRAGKREAVTDRGVHKGDNAVINIKIVDESGDGKNFMSIAGQTFPELDKAIEGMKVEEMKVATLTFPKDFQAKEWAGKKHKVHITIRSLTSVRMPDLDDDFAQAGVDKGLKSESLDELKSKIRARLEEAKRQMSEEFLNESIQEKILETSTIHVPDTMWEAVANQRLREIAGEVQKNGSTIEKYAEENGMSLDEMVAKWQAEAKVQVQRAVAANTIFRKEGMKLTSQDYNDTLVQMAHEYQAPPRELFEALKKNNALFEIEVRAVYRAVMDFLRKNASVNGDGKSAAKPKAAAKADAKTEEKPAKAEAKPKEKTEAKAEAKTPAKEKPAAKPKPKK